MYHMNLFIKFVILSPIINQNRVIAARDAIEAVAAAI